MAPAKQFIENLLHFQVCFDIIFEMNLPYNPFIQPLAENCPAVPKAYVIFLQICYTAVELERHPVGNDRRSELGCCSVSDGFSVNGRNKREQLIVNNKQEELMFNKSGNTSCQHHEGTTDLLSSIKKAYPELSRSDRKIAQVLLDTPEQFVNASVKEVAQIANVSDATVVRFGRNLGCEGFKDLKILLAQNLAVDHVLKDKALKDKAPKDAENGNPSIDRGSFINQIYHASSSVLEQAAQSIQIETLENAAGIIAGARRVFIYGTGGSSGILAMEIQNRLFHLNVMATAYTDSYLQCMSASTLNQGDVALFISSTGRPRSLQECAELAHHYGASCIAITDQSSALARQADVCIHVGISQSEGVPNQPNPMRYAQLFAIDCLAHRTALLIGDTAEQTLQRVRTSIASMHGVLPQQPIGD